MTELDAGQVAAIDKLLVRYITALDDKQMPGWLDTFSEDDAASYICIAHENIDRGLSLGFMYDDCRARLEDRVTFVTKVWAGTFQDYRTRHFVQRLSAEPIDPTSVKVRSNFTVYMTPEDTGVSTVLATGIYDDVVRLQDREARLFSRRAILDTSVLPRYLVYPV